MQLPDGSHEGATAGQLINRIARAFTRIGDARLRPLGFAVGQLPVLGALKDGAELSQAQLARLAKVEQPTMAQLLSRMERDGLIVRRPDPTDRRSSLVSLTTDARARLNEARSILDDGSRAALAGLSSTEVAELTALLQHVLTNVESLEA